MRTQALVIFSLILSVSLCQGYVDISKQTSTAVVNGRKCPQLFDAEMSTSQLKDGGIYAISFLAAAGKAEVWDPSEQNIVKRVRARLSKEPAQNLKAYLEALNPTMLQKVKKGAASALDFITGFIPYLNTVKAFVGLAVDAGQLYKDEAVKKDATFYMQCLDKLQATQDLPFSELMSNLIAREDKTVKTEIINAFKQATTGFGNALSCVHIPVHHIPTALNGLASIYARWGGHAQIETQTQNVDDLRKELKTILAQSKKHADMVESKAPAIIRSLVEMDDAAATELVRTISACRSVQNTPRYCNTIDGNYMTYQIQKFGVYLQYFLANRMDVLPDIFEGLPHDKAVALVNEALATAPCAK